ncbi:SDR family oxidoreductase [Pseudonocardia benzenivorans]|jgi:NAD(P)-dependent dehydrogenase (short-subunit alcohol dehydrogenase family)|uniref:Short-chain dehydrogenase/reductase SDR n=2 Tax=Pseudonocardia TaxID=1847 RepID=F4CQC4_PSEUX|nr:SDR family oxidoreductase [Pseudonocardia dioxanivorans]AEA28397.1 short-chain dehydrogenase/reductase SDR [Pseudonocardia dioxanivorans CB1190]GJF02494.1 short-chain dehydrogenase [Pseudonocardia sp. D17]
MEIRNAVALVTGANRGLGRHLAADLLERGAKVYAAARNPGAVDLPGAVPLALDITDPDAVAAAVAAAGDVTLLVNNAGSSTGAGLLDGDLADIRLEMETHYFGTLGMVRAFAPVIEANGGGGILDVLSVLSWVHPVPSAAYTAAKAAAWALTDAVRLELAPKGIVTTALHVGYMDTDMAAHVDGPKSDPVIVAKQALDAVAAGEYEVLADELSNRVRAGLAGGVAALYPQLAG